KTHHEVTKRQRQLISELAIYNKQDKEEKRIKNQQPTSFDDGNILQEDMTELDEEDKERKETNDEESSEKESKLTQKEIIDMLEKIVKQSKDKEDEEK